MIRTTPDRYEHILPIVGPNYIEKKKKQLYEPKSASEHFTLKLRLVTSRDFRQLLSFAFQISHTVINQVILDICEKLC